MASWTEDEFSEIDFNDERLNQRFSNLVEKLSSNAGQSIQIACQDWANTKAAYRFFDNPKVSSDEICQTHAKSTSQRIEATLTDPSSIVLVVQDTTYINYSRHPKTTGLGEISKFKGYRGETLKSEGFILHSSLALTEGGVPLGFIDQKLWTRTTKRIGKITKSGKNMTRLPIEEKESFRWIEAIRNTSSNITDPERIIHVGDRESDIFEFFHEARVTKTNFLVRIRDHQRCLAGDNDERIFDPMESMKAKGTFDIPVKNKDGKSRLAKLEVKFYPVLVRPSAAKKDLEPLPAFVISAIEVVAPKKEERVDWRLLTNLPVKSLKSALEKIKFYEMRWQIEVYHKVLKSGCRVEESRFRNADRLVRYVAVMTIVAWRIYWLSLVSRKAPDLPVEAVFTKDEKKVLKLYCTEKKISLDKQSANDYVRVVARLGGFLARKGDGDPGPLTLWRGYLRLQDIVLGISLAPP